MPYLKLILRIGIFGTFLGHGMFAFYVNPAWIPYLMVVGFSDTSARVLMPYIGILDFIVAFFALFLPLRIIILWAFIWTFATALVRPIAGLPVWDFVERSANWTVPLALLILQGIPRNLREWFST